MNISVIIPIYKPQNYLWECLDSLCNQTLDKRLYEVILVLNGCDEPYNTNIIEYIQKHSNVRWNYIQTNQVGVSNARNIALDVSQGEYITFIDDDDYVSSSYLEELFSLANKEIISLCYPVAFDDGTDEFYQYYVTRCYNQFVSYGKQPYINARKYFSGPVYKLIHKDIISNRRFNLNFKNGEDSLFMFEISDNYKYVDFTSKNAIYYRRIRTNSASQSQRFSYITNNCLKLMWITTKIYLNNYKNYSFDFYFTRILAFVHQILNICLKNIRQI